jgi:hypothetical protein
MDPMVSRERGPHPSSLRSRASRLRARVVDEGGAAGTMEWQAVGVVQEGVVARSTRAMLAQSLGRANYQVAVFECQHCKRAYQPAGADTVEIDAATLEAARCDAQQIDLTHGSASHGEKAAPARATQSVPPAVRRQVLLRDQKRCQIPGCRNTFGLDVHHIQPRSEGGTHGAPNLLGLCSVHHRSVHRGELHVSGSAPDHLSLQHADGTPYGGPVSAPRADVCKKVFGGLCWLGSSQTKPAAPSTSAWAMATVRSIPSPCCARRSRSSASRVALRAQAHQHSRPALGRHRAPVWASDSPELGVRWARLSHYARDENKRDGDVPLGAEPPLRKALERLG